MGQGCGFNRMDFLIILQCLMREELIQVVLISRIFGLCVHEQSFSLSFLLSHPSLFPSPVYVSVSRFFLREPRNPPWPWSCEIACWLLQGAAKPEGLKAAQSHMSIFSHPASHVCGFFSMLPGNPAYLPCVWGDSVCAYDLSSVIL